MRRVGQARKRDAGEGAIVKALEAVGATVFKVSGKGVPDLFVARRGAWYALEVKSKTGTLTPAQQWPDAGVSIVRNVEQALRAIGAIG